MAEMCAGCVCFAADIDGKWIRAELLLPSATRQLQLRDPQGCAHLLAQARASGGSGHLDAKANWSIEPCAIDDRQHGGAGGAVPCAGAGGFAGHCGEKRPR
jgi:hypothetical protein